MDQVNIELLKNILNKAVQISPMVVLGMYLIFYIVNKTVELIEKWPDRQDRKVIRNMFQESTRELVASSQKMVSFNDNISNLCNIFGILQNRISGIEQSLINIDKKINGILIKSETKK